MRVNPRIAVAFLVGLTLVGGSYLLSREKREGTKSEQVISSEKPIRSFIKVSDNDGDSLPDWQNSLRTPALQIDEASDGSLTKTAEFAIELAEMTQSGGTDTFSITANLGAKVSQSILDKPYTQNDITIIEANDNFSLRNYGNAVAGIALNNSSAGIEEDELTILNRALLRNNPEVLEDLDPIIESYSTMASDMLNTPVPSSLTNEHLALINVYQALANDIKAFRDTFTDALPAISRMQRYQADAEALYIAISNLYLKLDQKGIQWTEGDITSRFIELQ